MSEFQIIPAIDILAGQVVRLYQGDYRKSKIYQKNPEKAMLNLVAAGAKRIHIIDLDAAKTGKPLNFELIKKLIKKCPVPVQLGGGLRTIAMLKKATTTGADCLILGTAALTQPQFLKKALKLYREKIIVSLDARADQIAVRGWIKKTNQNLFETARRLEKIGVKKIIYTDISRDGTLAGPNLKNLKKLAQSVKIPVIASGGIGSLKDIQNVARLEKFGVEAVIVGKAIYSGKLNVNFLFRQFASN